MINSTSKMGRPVAVYRTTWGDQIPGLLRLTDGRWRLSGKDKITFTESDERLAVTRFREIEAKRAGVDRVLLPVGNANVHDIKPLIKKALNPRIEIRIPRDHTKGVTVSHSFDTTEAWAWFREQILTRPKHVAERIGIEQIGYLTDIKRPTDSLKIDTLIDVYAAKPGLSTEEVSRCRRFWNEFAKIVKVKTIRDITHEHVEAYETKLGSLGLAPKSIKHRYSGVRTVIAYAMKRGRGVEDCRKALDTLAMLSVDNAHPLDPKPISPDDFWAVHAAAVKAGDKVFAALLITSLNCALYSSEVGAMRWSDVNLDRGEFVTRRNKTKVPRVAVLWPETVKAIKTLPRERETIFNTSVMAYGRQSIFREWTTYRKAAKVRDGVTFSMIRDAAFTSACRVSLDQARVLAGHRLPGAVDHYVLRQPQFVAPVCKAIRKEFYGK